MNRCLRQIGTLSVVMALCATAGWAQEKESSDTPTQPVLPLPGGESSSKASPAADKPSARGATAPSPDTRPLTGAEELTLGSLGGRRSYVISSLHFQQFADSNSTIAPGVSNFESASFLSGGLALQRMWRHSELALSYQGGGTMYNTESQVDQSFHAMNFSQRIMWGRWNLLLADQASYLPESSFGYAGAGLGTLSNSFGGVAGDLNPAIIPSQSILTGRACRVSNACVGEIQYNPSRRSSVTVSGSYGLLHFLDPGFTDNNNVLLRTGYNYSVSRRNSIGVLYGYSRFSFSQSPDKLENHVVQFDYGRRITGRLALQLGAGPQINTFKTAAASSPTQVSVSIGGQLHYDRGRVAYSLSYLRGMTGGSGALFGAQSDVVRADVNRQLSRQWSGGLNFGFAHNKALQQTTTGPNDARFRSYSGGASLSWRMGRRMRGLLSYIIEQQSSSVSVCMTATCGTDFVRHQIGIGIDWSSRQIPID